MVRPSDDIGYEPGSTIPRGGTNTANRRMPDPDDPLNTQVFMGAGKGRGYDARQAKVADQLGESYTGYIVRTRQNPTINQLMLSFNSFDHKDFLALRSRLAAAGYADPKGDALSVREGYLQALMDASTIQRNRGNRNLSFDDYINNLIRMNGGDPNNPGAGMPGERKRWKQTNTQRDVYELDPAEARGMMIGTLQQYLGRDPTKTEVQDYLNAVQTRAEDDPTVTRTTTQYTKKGLESDTTRKTLETGFTDTDAELLAIDKAKAAPDYAKYQSVSTYFPVIEQLLQASA